MISTIIKILNLKEKYYFKYILILMFVNSFFELVSLAVFYPFIKFLTDATYGLDFVNRYLIKFDYQSANHTFIGTLYFIITAEFPSDSDVQLRKKSLQSKDKKTVE